MHNPNLTDLQRQLQLQEPISPDLFATVAEDAALLCKNARKNRPAQIRRFYDELVMWDEKVNLRDKSEREAAFREARPYIQMIRAKLAYSLGRELLNTDFHTLFDGLIRQINSPETLRNAKLFFEAYLGFSKSFENLSK